MNMDNIVVQSKQKGDELLSASRIVHVVGIGAPKSSEIDDTTEDRTGSEVLADRHQIALNAAVGRGKWSDLEDPHERLS